MARIIDQAPQYQDNTPEDPSENNAALEQSPAHEPLRHVNTSLEEAVGNRLLKNMGKDGDLGIPDRIPQHVIDNPDAGGAKELPEKKNPWIKRSIAAVSIAAGVAGVFHAVSSSNEDFDAGDRADAVATGEAFPGQNQEQDYSKIDIATYPHESFIQLPYGVQVDKSARYFDQSFENGAVDKYISDAATVNGYKLKGGVGTGSINDSAQEISNRITVEVNTYRHESNLNLARNLVSGVFKPGTASYESEMKRIGDGGEMLPSTNATYESTPVFTQGKFGGIEANGTPTRIIDTGEMVTGRVFDMIIQEEKSSIDPSITKVVVVAEIGAKDPGSTYRELLNNWTPSS